MTCWPTALITLLRWSADENSFLARIISVAPAPLVLESSAPGVAGDWGQVTKERLQRLAGWTMSTRSGVAGSLPAVSVVEVGMKAVDRLVRKRPDRLSEGKCSERRIDWPVSSVVLDWNLTENKLSPVKGLTPPPIVSEPQ
ncbi:uncharacterized protein BDZ83DRAFT_647291 [Colletotrichum acutatum]|uniref:Uncharacterized protein n=1 Tax=Glomerella acutata TaxID=27357 RepID=A0AAD9D1L5_GLOAC|nr:uncharacterized protein BDZ83DRAFT_647291 [Colletotrichum acutatum]KAK1730119.1 hypothetical protein BDZ83DRAFT_647291 [Colletotrichum acutatum]